MNKEIPKSEFGLYGFEEWFKQFDMSGITTQQIATIHSVAKAAWNQAIKEYKATDWYPQA